MFQDRHQVQARRNTWSPLCPIQFDLVHHTPLKHSSNNTFLLKGPIGIRGDASNCIPWNSKYHLIVQSDEIETWQLWRPWYTFFDVASMWIPLVFTQSTQIQNIASQGRHPADSFHSLHTSAFSTCFIRLFTFADLVALPSCDCSFQALN